MTCWMCRRAQIRNWNSFEGLPPPPHYHPDRKEQCTMKKLSILTTAFWMAALGWMPLPLQAQLDLNPANFTSADIGAPARPGSVTQVSGGYAITGGGTNIAGISDQFQFNYQSFTGDFDVSVRLDSLTFTEAWTKAGLMA